MAEGGNDQELHPVILRHASDGCVRIDSEFVKQPVRPLSFPFVVETADKQQKLSCRKRRIKMRDVPDVSRTEPYVHIVLVRLHSKNRNAARRGPHESPKELKQCRL